MFLNYSAPVNQQSKPDKVLKAEVPIAIGRNAIPTLPRQLHLGVKNTK
jgi:hypothetical protein